MKKISHLVHADWSINPKKRIACYASLQNNDKYHIFAPQSVGALAEFLNSVKNLLGEGDCALVGFDFPIGIPIRYAEIANISEFTDFLIQLGKGCHSEFYNVAAVPDHISITRPFYPRRPSGAKRNQLTGALGVKDFNELRRICEKRTPYRRAACPIFWTIGPQQVGKAAISGWRDVLIPGLENDSLNLKLWPFSGDLDELILEDHIIVVETYPAEYYTHFGIEFRKNLGGGKKYAPARASFAPIFQNLAHKFNVDFDPILQINLNNGFDNDYYGDDAFDACIGLLGMLNVILGYRSPGAPDDAIIRRVEGWIFGQSPQKFNLAS